MTDLSPEREAAIEHILSYSNAWAHLVCSGVDPDAAHGVLTAAARDGEVPVERGELRLTVTHADGRYRVVPGKRAGVLSEEMLKALALVLTEARYSVMALPPSARSALNLVMEQIGFDRQYARHGSAFEAVLGGLREAGL